MLRYLGSEFFNEALSFAVAGLGRVKARTMFLLRSIERILEPSQN
jgi:hypothetical protein